MAPMITAGIASTMHPIEAAIESPWAFRAVLHDNTRWK